MFSHCLFRKPRLYERRVLMSGRLESKLNPVSSDTHCIPVQKDTKCEYKNIMYFCVFGFIR